MRPHNLPRQPSRLVGRQTELNMAQQRLLDPGVRLVTLSGPGGVGKTRLALAIADALFDTFDDGVFFVDLATLTDPSLVIAAIAQALGLREHGDRSPDGQVARFLRDKHVLLVLDNFEQVVDAAFTLVDLLAETSYLKFLVTSRSLLRVSWEHEFPVPPLALPDEDARLTLAAIRTCPAGALFVERARAVEPDFEIDERNARTIASICARLDGLPLAIELAAARIKFLAPEAILAWLEREAGRSPFQLLATDRRDLPPRHLALRAEIDWSYQLLDPAEQAFFRRLGVFAGDFTLESAEFVCLENVESRLGDGAVCCALGLLESLVDKSLLFQRKPSEHEVAEHPRFAMLQTIREYALEKLAASGELGSMRRQHAMFFVTLAERAEQDLSGVGQTRELDRLEREHDDLRAALTWCLDNDPEMAVRVVGHLWRFWEVHCHLREGRRWLEAAIARSDGVGADLRAKALMGLGTIAWRQADYASATVFHTESLALYQSVGDLHGVARSLNNLGAQAQNLRDLERATCLLEQSLTVSRQLGDRNVSAMALINLGTIAMERGEYDLARGRFELALDLSRKIQNAQYTVVALEDLGETLHHQGELTGALSRLEEGLRIAWTLEARSDVAFCLEELAGVSADLGCAVKAARLFGAAEAVRDAVNAPVPPSHRAQYYDRQVASLRNYLGIRAFARAWADGQKLSIRQAVEYALESPASEDVEVETDALTSPSSRSCGPLTHREQEVAMLIARGRTNREIAEQLMITAGTAANHVLHILNKLGFHSRAEIAAWAVAHGLREDLAARPGK